MRYEIEVLNKWWLKVSSVTHYHWKGNKRIIKH